MKLLSVVVPTLLATSVSARSTVFSQHDVSAQDDLTFPVPGDNPLVHCADPADDILAIKSIEISPNPPKAGETLKVIANGVLSEDVEEGAKVHLSVKYGWVKIINQEQDLCEVAKNVDLECPLKKGDIKLVKEVDLPKQIPPGKYEVEANVYTKDHKANITCLQAKVEFHAGSATGLFKQDV